MVSPLQCSGFALSGLEPHAGVYRPMPSPRAAPLAHWCELQMTMHLMRPTCSSISRRSVAQNSS